MVMPAGGGGSPRRGKSSRPGRGSGSGKVSGDGRGSGRAGAGDSSASRGVASMMRRLPEMERRVLDLRFGLSGGHPMRASQVASELGISSAEVSEIESRALERLRVVVPADRMADLIKLLSAERG